jgi:hypothetical protein
VNKIQCRLADLRKGLPSNVSTEDHFKDVKTLAEAKYILEILFPKATAPDAFKDILSSQLNALHSRKISENSEDKKGASVKSSSGSSTYVRANSSSSSDNSKDKNDKINNEKVMITDKTAEISIKNGLNSSDNNVKNKNETNRSDQVKNFSNMLTNINQNLKNDFGGKLDQSKNGTEKIINNDNTDIRKNQLEEFKRKKEEHSLKNSSISNNKNINNENVNVHNANGDKTRAIVGGKPVSGPPGVGVLGVKPRVNFDNNNISNIKKDKISKNFIEINKQKCIDLNNVDKNSDKGLKVNENNDDDDNDKSYYENDESYYPESEEEVEEEDDEEYNARFVCFIIVVFFYLIMLF